MIVRPAPQDAVHYRDLLPLEDDKRVLANPHKGWYFHYLDNHLNKYGAGLEEGDFLEDFPALNHLYLRLAWSYLEPREGEFEWSVLDDIIGPWTARGTRIAFRVSCVETSADQCFSTPEWVMDAGVPGAFFKARQGEGQIWEPDYGHPVFLEKLEAFHRAFAERYADKWWLEYIDIGSYGAWGEGHTVVTSKRDWPLQILKAHVEMHLRHYPNNVVMINDDHAGCRYEFPETQQPLLDYFVSKGLAIRDDSVCVKFYADKHGYDTLRFPWIYDRFWPVAPVDLELDHYGRVKETGLWKAGLPFYAAAERTHATYLGFHGHAREWLADNADYAQWLGNLAGYWYFLTGLDHAPEVPAGSRLLFTMYWENRGLAPAYNKFDVTLRLVDADGKPAHETTLSEIDNRRWPPKTPVRESVVLAIPPSVAPGTYDLHLGLASSHPQRTTPVDLALKIEARGEDGFFNVGRLTVT